MSEEEQRISSHKFHRNCYEMRVPIWLGAICLCLASLVFAPSFFKSGDEYLLVGILMLLGALASLCWAVWSSSYKT